MKTSAVVRYPRLDAPALLRTPGFAVYATRNSLFSALVSALLESLSPGTPVEVSDLPAANLRETDVLVEQKLTGRRLVVFGSAPTPQAVAGHLDAGVYSLVGVDGSRAELLASIGSLSVGPAFVSSSIVRFLAGEVSTPQSHVTLTPREREVLRLVVDGNSNKEMAGILCLSPNTVRSHLQSISAKLGVGSRAKLAARARALGIV